jgi:hypothetical protein
LMVAGRVDCGSLKYMKWDDFETDSSGCIQI